MQIDLKTVLAIVSSLSILATVRTLWSAWRDKRLREEKGINGVMAMLAWQAVVIECLRIVKHILAAAGIWLYLIGHPQLWLNTAYCLLLGFTSLLSEWHRHKVEQKTAQEKRAAMLKPAIAPSPDFGSK